MTSASDFKCASKSLLKSIVYNCSAANTMVIPSVWFAAHASSDPCLCKHSSSKRMSKLCLVSEPCVRCLATQSALPIDHVSPCSRVCDVGNTSTNPSLLFPNISIGNARLTCVTSE